MTVGDNIKFGLKLRKMPADQQEEILNKYLKIIKLENSVTVIQGSFPVV